MAVPVKAGQRLEIVAEAHPGGWLVRLTGVIDENFDRHRLVEGRQGVFVFDLDGVRRITSFGVREWVTAMSEIPWACFFIRCRPAFVMQLNMVANFAGRGQLVSLYAPYSCTQCHAEFEVLIDRRRRSGGALSAGTTCPHCQGKAEFDDIPETFFSYALTASPPLLPPLAEAIIDGPEAPASARLRIEKEIQGQVTVLWLAGPLDKSTRLKRVAEGLEGTVVVVLMGVTTATKDGLARFRELTSAPDVELFLACVPLGIAHVLCRAPDALGGARVLSLRVTVTCAACGQTVDLDADGAAVQRMALGHVPQCCSGCGARMTYTRATELWDTLGLPFAQAPADLKGCTFSPTADSSDDTTMRSEHALIPQSSQGPPSSTPISVRFVANSKTLVEPYAIAGRLRRLEVLRSIATGGMATVYLARVIGAGGFERLVAIKIMHPHIAGDPSFVAMFLDEARLAARIHHPNVVATLDIDQTEEDGLYMMMEYIEGLSVRQINRKVHRLRSTTPLPIALRMILDALAGLHAAHELTDVDGTPLHLVHRDVSPPNLLTGVDGITRVSDFGIARAKSRLGMTTKRGEIKGKVGYMAPEQLGAGPVDRRIDVYAVSVVLWELLTGQKAFRGESDAVTLARALEGIAKPPSEWNPAVPAEIDEVCMRALARDPAYRFPTAAAFADALESAAHAAGVAVASAREVGAFIKELAEEER